MQYQAYLKSTLALIAVFLISSPHSQWLSMYSKLQNEMVEEQALLPSFQGDLTIP